MGCGCALSPVHLQNPDCAACDTPKRLVRPSDLVWSRTGSSAAARACSNVELSPKAMKLIDALNIEPCNNADENTNSCCRDARPVSGQADCTFPLVAAAKNSIRRESYSFNAGVRFVFVPLRKTRNAAKLPGYESQLRSQTAGLAKSVAFSGGSLKA